MNDHEESNSYSKLQKLLDTSEAMASRQEQAGSDVDSQIRKMNASTVNRNIARDSQNRSKIASRLTSTFVVLISAIIFLTPIYNATIGANAQLSLSSLLESFNSVFGPVLGFVLGYYFKDRDSGKNNG